MSEEVDPAPPAGMDKQVQSATLPVAWTQMGANPFEPAEEQKEIPIRFPSDVVEISKEPEETELCIVGTHGQKITKMGEALYNQCSPNLTHLILRSHVIKKMEGLRGFQNLTLLELYDNSIKALEDLNSGEDGKPGITLKVLDMSYNVIRDMLPVQFCPNLTELCKSIR